MHVFKNTWYENSVSIERGPITYALKIGEEVKLITNEKDPLAYGNTYYEVRPATPWNYGLLDIPADNYPTTIPLKKQMLQLIFRGTL